MALFKNIDEIKGFLPVNASFDWERIKPFVERAQEKYLRPELGSAQLAELQAAYDGESLSGAQQKLLHLVRVALANWAYFLYLPHGNVQLSNAGAQTAANANKKPALEWMVNDLSRSFQEAGYEGIDSMLEYLEENQLLFPAWANSAAFTVQKQFFITRAAEFSRFVNINNSRRTFQALGATIRKVEHELRRSVIGAGLFDEVKSQQQAGTLTALNRQLLQLLQPAVAYLAMARATVELSVIVGEHGISVFNNNSSHTTRALQPAPREILLQLREDHQRDGEDCLRDLAAFLTENADSLPLYKNSNLYVATVTGTFENDKDSGVYGFF